MMIALLTTAALCLALAAFSFLGLPYLLTGGYFLDQLRERLTHKAVVGGLLAAAISLVWVLQASPALISHAPGVQVITDEITGCGWQI